jgi:predicted RNase H-like HicB family nuclease
VKYRVGIAHAGDGSASIWVFDLPGCRAVGKDLDEARALLPIVVAEHASWLRRHGEEVPEEADFEPVEEVDLRGEFVFEADKAALSDAELETALRHISHAQADLIAVAKPLPTIVRQWRPPNSAVKIDFVPDARQIDEMLVHVAGVEAGYYLGSLSDAAPPILTPEPEDAFVLAGATAARIRGWTAEVKSGRVYRQSTPRGEGFWTARKVLRRIMAHKRFHTKEIEQRLAWLTLGVPEVLPQNRE